MKHNTVHQTTPQVVVYDNQGLTVRVINYYRAEAEDAAVLRVNLQAYDGAGYLKHSIDARLSELYLNNPDGTISNQNQINTLRGAVLQSKNVDAGMRVSISDVRGLTLWTKDSVGNERRFDYDKLSRVTSVSEKTSGKKVLDCERFVYGDNTSKEVNGIGRLLEHYDMAGLREIKSYSLLGSVLNESRQFLATNIDVDWPEGLTERQKLLETERYTTQWNYNSLGETVSQTDAKDNKWRIQYGIAGELIAFSLQLKTGTEQHVVDKQVYSAAGQLLEKRLANGVVINYSYEEKTQRLSRLHSVRFSDSELLQDLNYRYDPIGNILEITDKAKEPNFYTNEKTETVSQYRYDSLYQLIEAKGIESQQAAKESTTRNPALRLGNADASRCVNYTRNYIYDASSNLYKIQHRGAQIYTQCLTIDSNSNRGIEKRDSGPSLVESFDHNGNLLYLNTGQPLQWNSRNQLHKAIQLKRKTHSDTESYRYDGLGQRAEKLTQRLAQEQLHISRVRYLPGLELREYWQTDTSGENQNVTEQLQVIQRDGVRVLHWETGKPDDIENNGLRYTLTDQLGSCQLELNAKGEIISYETYYPYGGSAIWATKNAIETHCKFIRYSGKEQDATGLYYYGYRYYLPWLGRWLNPDPAGSSDDLNLFRMAYNNPISFYDSDGKAPIESNYQPDRGDLIYGLSSFRMDYLQLISNKYYPEYKGDFYPPLIVDSYNNAVAEAIHLEENFQEYFSKYREEKEAFIELAKKIENSAGIKKRVLNSYPDYPLWSEYFSLAAEDKKFNFSNIYRETGEKYEIEPFHNYTQESGIITTELLWKKGSKLGLKIAASSQKIHIHFILDELDIESIVHKSGSAGQSITASELRYIYRNWDRLKENVHFYEYNEEYKFNRNEVKAPWLENSTLWNEYKPKRKMQ